MTTLQLLLKAFQDVAKARGIDNYVNAISRLLQNDDPLIVEPQKRLKLWPTRTDQQDYRHVMDASSPAELLQLVGRPADKYPIKNHNIANAYLFFHNEIEAWIAADEDNAEVRITGLYGAIRDQLRLVVIDLDEKDDARAIFETLYAQMEQKLLNKPFIKGLFPQGGGNAPPRQ